MGGLLLVICFYDEWKNERPLCTIFNLVRVLMPGAIKFYGEILIRFTLGCFGLFSSVGKLSTYHEVMLSPSSISNICFRTLEGGSYIRPEAGCQNQ
jgi:hypothetical protein